MIYFTWQSFQKFWNISIISKNVLVGYLWISKSFIILHECANFASKLKITSKIWFRNKFSKPHELAQYSFHFYCNFLFFFFFYSLRVTTSVYPIPCISHEDHLGDWFNSLGECLHWNRRETKRTTSFKRQKPVNGMK